MVKLPHRSQLGLVTSGNRFFKLFVLYPWLLILWCGWVFKVNWFCSCVSLQNKFKVIFSLTKLSYISSLTLSLLKNLFARCTGWGQQGECIGTCTFEDLFLSRLFLYYTLQIPAPISLLNWRNHVWKLLDWRVLFSLIIYMSLTFANNQKKEIFKPQTNRWHQWTTITQRFFARTGLDYNLGKLR